MMTTGIVARCGSLCRTFRNVHPSITGIMRSRSRGCDLPVPPGPEEEATPSVGGECSGSRGFHTPRDRGLQVDEPDRSGAPTSLRVADPPR
jgi:hypothetical protein